MPVSKHSKHFLIKEIVDGQNGCPDAQVGGGHMRDTRSLSLVARAVSLFNLKRVPLGIVYKVAHFVHVFD